MVKAQFNRFTRWFVVGVTILMLGILLSLVRAGKALAVSPNEKPLKSAPSAVVTILPNRIMMPPDWAPATVTLTDYTVNTAIKDNVATTTITQTYKNTSGRTLEARYLFPLPPDANFSSFTLTVNGKALEGKILEKDQARRTYQDIVRKLVDPGLLEYMDDKTVQVSIAPFFAGETKQIRLSYTQLLKQDGGLAKYTYFLGSQAPGTVNRPVPRLMRPMDDQASSKGLRKQPAAELTATAPKLVLKLTLNTSQALKTIYSSTHDPKITRMGANKAAVELSLTPETIKQEKNFVLYFSQDNRSIALNTLNYQREGEDGYFLMTIRTPDLLQKRQPLPKDVVLVLDTSGSMGGEKIKQAKEALKYIIQQLRPEDRFGLLQFNTDVSALNSELVPANAEKKQQALSYIDGLQAGGSTNIEAALKDGFAQLKNHDAKRPAYVIFLTDGEPTVGVTDTEGLVKTAAQANTADAKLFSFGVGYDLNAVLLGKLSDQQHGSTTFVEPNENLETAVTGFYKKIESPVLTDAALRFDGVTVSKLYPEKLGDLFAGGDIVLLGRYAEKGQKAQGAAVTLTGKVGLEVQSFSYPIHWAANTVNSELPRLWAGRRIAYLLDAIRQNGENSELKDEVIALSKQYGIITPYTSYLSVEPADYHRPMGHAINTTPRLYNGPAAAAPMASRAAMDAASGQGAVKLSKSLNAMKSQASASALNAAQATSAEASGVEPTLKTIGAKTFVRAANGIWTDTAYNAADMGRPIQVTFGSDAYFKLLGDKPELRPYFALGEQVIVVLDNPDGSRQMYQVLPTKTG